VSDEPIYTMQEGATGLNELYVSLRNGGFGRWAALWLCGCMLKSVPLPDWFADRLRDSENP
jgi:hypothetical protein